MKNQFNALHNKSLRFPIIITVIALLLIGVMTFNFIMYKPFVAQAAALKTYISDVKILTCTEAEFNDESRKLKAEGYTVDRKYNFAEQDVDEDLYDDMNEPRAYLAYKTTNDYRNAITDLAFMNMKGPYSFADYEKLLDNQKELASSITEKLSLGLKLFRSNYVAETPASQFAYKMLNYYREDDSGKLMGDFLLQPNLSNEVLSDVILQISDITLSTINCLVAVACSNVAGQEDWITRLTNMTEDDLKKAKGLGSNVLKGDVLIRTIQKGNADFKQYDSYLKEIKRAFGSEGYNEEDPAQVELHEAITNDYYLDVTKLYNIQSVYQVLAGIPYSDPTISYSPLGTFGGEHEGKGSLVGLFLDNNRLTGEDLSGWGSLFTDEQIAMIYLTGLDQFITSEGHSEEAWKEIETKMNNIVKYDYSNTNKESPIASVYMGVDRALYDTAGIALTDEAARRQFVDSEDVWYNGNMPEEAEIALYVIGGIGAAMMLGSASYTFLTTGKVFTTYIKTMSSAQTAINKLTAQGAKISESLKVKVGLSKFTYVQNQAETGLRGTMRSLFRGDRGICLANRVGGMVFAVGMFVLMLAVTIYLIVELILSFEKNYTTVPTMIINNFSKEKNVIEVVDGKDKLVPRTMSIYTKYKAVVNQNGDFADINLGGKEWIVPYVSKDADAGNPILLDLQIMRKRTAVPIGYSPMHRIGFKDFYNGHANSSDKPLYVAFKRDANAAPRTASSFSGGAFTLALCGGILGGGLLGWLATWLIIKNKRKNKLIAELTAKTTENKE